MTTDTTTEITEGDWKTLATTEITHLTDEEKDYLPRAWDEWIARVKRDAAREALDGLAEHIDWTASQFLGVRVGSQKAQDVRTYRDTNYPTPEETP